VNQHGPAPFNFYLSLGNDDFTIPLATNIANTVTAGPDGYNGVNVPIIIPDNVCDPCAIQLKGMGQIGGAGEWSDHHLNFICPFCFPFLNSFPHLPPGTTVLTSRSLLLAL